MRQLLLFFVLLLLQPVVAPAQEAFYTHTQTFDKREGYQMLEEPWYLTQDKRGLLWIGGDNGLFSFDGTHFKNYRHRKNDSASLPANFVLYNYQDRHGVYWAAVPNRGLYNFDPRTGTFKRFRYNNEVAFDIHTFNPYLPIETKSGELYFPVPYFGIVKYDRRQNKMVPYKVCPPGSCGAYYNTSHVSCLAEDPQDGTLWAGTNDGLLHFFPANGEITVYRDKARKTTAHLMGQVITSLYFDDKGNLWTGTWGYGLKKFDRIKKRFEEHLWYRGSITGSKNICQNIGSYDADHLWVNTLDAGLLVFNITAQRFLPVRKSGVEDKILFGNKSFQNKKGVLWVADASRLTRIHPAENGFAYRDLKTLFPSKSIARSAISFVRQEQTLFVAFHNDGFFGEYNLASGKLTVHSAPLYLDKGLRHLVADREGNVWLGGQYGVAVFHPRTKTFLQLRPPPAMPDAFKLRTSTILHDSDGTVWMGTEKGLLHYNQAQQTIQRYKYDTAANERVRDKKYYANTLSLYKDRNGNLWFGNTLVGLGCIRAKTGQLVFFNKRRNPNYPESSCTSISEAKDGSILFTLEKVGLCILKNPFTKKENVQVLTSTDGLPADDIFRVFTDGTDNTWLFTPNGLAWFNPVTSQCRRFGTEDGLAQSFINSKPYQDSEGRIYIGANYGFQWFDPQKLLAAPAEESSIHLASLNIAGKDWPVNPDFLTSLQLNQNQSSIRFEFAPLSLNHTTAIQYAYKLEGFEADWHNTGVKTSGQYTNIPPGNYTLRIRAMNNTGAWNKKEYALPVVIHPPWYGTWWFYTLAGLLVAGIIYAFFRYRLNRVRHESRLKSIFTKKIHETEMRALRAQMNPHFIFNCLNSINRYIVKSDHKTASNYLTKFAKLIRLILDNSANETITLDKEIQTLQLYIDMEILRFDNEFDYSVEMDEGIVPETINIPSMLLQPYVENAIWHGLLHKEAGGGKLWIRFHQPSEKIITAEVEDNGVGRDMAKELRSKEVIRKKSYGMQISKDRILLINELYNINATVQVADLKNGYGEATGTKVTIEMPVKNL